MKHLTTLLDNHKEKAYEAKRKRWGKLLCKHRENQGKLIEKESWVG